MSLTLPEDAADWVDVWRDRINEREEFVSAAEGFSAAFLFEIRTDGTYEGEPIEFRISIEEGVCTAADVASDPAYDFALRGPYTAWKGLLEGDIDVSVAVMDGTFDLEGETMTLLRRQDAIAEMVVAARGVDTEFEH